MEDVEYWTNKAKETGITDRVKEFKIEYLEYWANKGKNTKHGGISLS